MTELDKALENLRQDTNDQKRQSRFYDLFLNMKFFVPIITGEAAKQAGIQEGQVLPLVMESDGNDYLMIFDTKDRLTAWAQPETEFVEVPGHMLAATSVAPLHWALNVGTDYSKQFLPDEIAWLKDAVERCNAQAAAAQAQQGESPKE